MPRPRPAAALPRRRSPESRCRGGAALQRDRRHRRALDARPRRGAAQGVAGVIEQVNALEEDEGLGCDGDAGPDIALWFRYSDGRAAAVRYGDYGCRWITVGDDQTPRVGGEAVVDAVREGIEAQEGPAPTLAMEEGLTVRNRTGEFLWIFTPWGNQGGIEPGEQIEYVGECTFLPLRAETVAGEVVGYFAGPCRESTWTVDSVEPAPDDPATSGRVAGRLVYEPDPRRPITQGGVTFEGPVTRSVSTDRDGRFEVTLPVGTYSVRGGSSALPGGRSDLACPGPAALVVTSSGTATVDVLCGGR